MYLCTWYLFSITSFAAHGHQATIHHTFVTLFFGTQQQPITIPIIYGHQTASHVKVINSASTNINNNTHHVPDRIRSRSSKKFIGLQLLHNRLAHCALRSLLAADEHNIWNDVKIHMDPEQDCVSFKIAIIRATARNAHPHMPSTHPGHTTFMDIIHPISDIGLNPSTSVPFYLLLVDAFSRYSSIYSLPVKSTDSVIQAIENFIADNPHLSYYTYYRSPDTPLSFSCLT